MNLSELRTLPTDRLLVVVPHPDDEAIGCSGLLFTHVSAGGKACVVMVTDGNRRHKGEMRVKELRNSLEVLGLAPDTDLILLEFADGYLKRHESEMRQKLDEIVKDWQPTIVIATDPADRHADHWLIGRWAWALENLKVYTFLAHHRFWPMPFGKKPEAFLLPPRAQAKLGAWYTVTLSEEAKERKLRSILSHASQHHVLLHGLLMSFWRVNELFRSPY